jgi:hypothetical protein
MAALALRNQQYDAARRAVAAASAAANAIAWDAVEALRLASVAARARETDAARARSEHERTVASSKRDLEYYRDEKLRIERRIAAQEQHVAEQEVRLLAQDGKVAAAKSAADAARAEFARADADAARRGGGAEAAHSRRGELFIDVLSIVAGAGFAAEVARCRQLCGTTWRRGIRRDDGSLDTAGFAGGTNDMMVRSLARQVSWAAAARLEARKTFSRPPPRQGFIFGSTSLIRAISSYDVPRLLLLVHLGAPLGASDADGRSAVHHAALSGWKAGQKSTLLDDLLENRWRNEGDVVNKCDKAGVSPISIASKYGSARHIKTLIKHGARVGREGRSWDFTSALHEAVKCNSMRKADFLCLSDVPLALDCIKLLLRAPGAVQALSCTDSEGLTPRALALKLNKRGIADLLVVPGQ